MTATDPALRSPSETARRASCAPAASRRPRRRLGTRAPSAGCESTFSRGRSTSPSPSCSWRWCCTSYRRWSLPVHRCGMVGHRPRILSSSPRSSPKSAPAGPSSGIALAYFTYGSYPLAGALAGRRLLRPARDRHRLAGVAEAPRRDLGAIYFFVVLAVVSFFLLSGATGSACPASTRAVGRHPGHASSCAAVGIVVSLPLGIMLALGRRSQMPAVRLFSRHLHRVRARRAADHRAVHGERDAAAVRAGRYSARQTAARADRHRAVRLGLHGRGRARRPAGHPQGPVRGRDGAGPAATGR